MSSHGPEYLSIIAQLWLTVNTGSLMSSHGPDTLNYLRIPYLMEIEFSTTGAPKHDILG